MSDLQVFHLNRGNDLVIVLTSVLYISLHTCQTTLFGDKGTTFMWIDENHIHFLDFIFSCCHIRNYSTPLGCVKSAKY